MSNIRQHLHSYASLMSPSTTVYETIALVIRAGQESPNCTTVVLLVTALCLSVPETCNEFEKI